MRARKRRDVTSLISRFQKAFAFVVIVLLIVDDDTQQAIIEWFVKRIKGKEAHNGGVDFRHMELAR